MVQQGYKTGTAVLVVVQGADLEIAVERRMCVPSCLSIPLVPRGNCLVEDQAVVVTSFHSCVAEVGRP